jgi:hypothetical protein
LKYYPPLSQLIAREALPGDIGILAGINETVEQVLDRLLAGIRFKDLVINQSAFGDVRFYSLTIVAKELGLELPGTGISFLLFPGADGSGEANIPTTCEWRWGIKRYVNDFEAALFSHSPLAFFDLLLKVANISEAQFVDGIIRTFIGDPNPYVKLVQDIKGLISDYNAGIATLNDPSGEILAHAGDILPSLDTLIADLQDPAQLGVLFESEVDHIADSLENIATTLDIELNVCRLAFDTVTRAIEDADGRIHSLVVLFGSWFGGFDWHDIEELLIPQISVSLGPLKVGIRFPSNVLREVTAEGEPIPDPQNPEEDKPAVLTCDVASLTYSTARGFEFDLVDSLNFDFPKSEILKSGFTLQLEEAKIDFSRTTNIPEAIADGRPADFVGVYVKEGTITFPASWNQDPTSTGVIKTRNLLVGTGGITGTLELEAITHGDLSPIVKVTFGKDFSISLDAFSIKLQQNAFKESKIKGTLIIPGFKKENHETDPAIIDIDVDIRQGGDFDITGRAVGGLKISCGKVFDVTLKSVRLGKQDGDFCLEVAGSIKFTSDLLKDIDAIEVEKLIIYSDGRFAFEGGTLPLPKNIRFPIGPATLSISAIHLGSHQREHKGKLRKYRCFGFDGGIDINPGGLDVRGNGITFYFTVDGEPFDSYLEIKSIAIDLVIPGNASRDTATLLLSGFLNMPTEKDPEYAGGVSFWLPKLKISGAASMRLQPKVPAFLVDAFVELSTPIPLGATSLGIYGFRGLFGQRYVATKSAAGLQDTNTWFDYYKVLRPTEGVTDKKFDGPGETKNYANPFSVGAGLTLAVTKDSGRPFSCKLFLLLSRPDLVYLEGKANILGPRVGLTGEDPPFSAVLALSSQSVELGAGVNYTLPREGGNKGQILDLNAELRAAFFFHNSSAWYLNLGTIEKPVTARILTLFDASAYLMLSASGIVAGASVTFGFKKSYLGGTVKADVGVYIAVGGFISFERPQIGGFAKLGGHVDVSLLRFSFYLSIDTSLSVEAPKPFYIEGSVTLCVGIKIFKKQIKKCFNVEFKWEKDSEVDRTPVPPLADPRVRPPLKATNMLSGESFNVTFLDSPPWPFDPVFDRAVLPLDSWIDMEFLKGLVPSSKVDERVGRLSGQAPANTIDLVPPAQVTHPVKHAYSIEEMEIKAWTGSAWVDYHPYEAMKPPDAFASPNTDPSAYKDGFWQNTGAGFSKLRLLAETSLSYMQQGQPGWYIPEQFDITNSTLFCRGKLRQKRCIRWVETALGTVYLDGDWHQIDTVLFRVSGGPGTVVDWPNHHDIPRSLVFSNEATAQLVFNEPCAEVTLTLTTFSTGAVIRFYKRETVGVRFVYTLAETRALTQLELLAPVKYNNSAVPIAKVEIDPTKADPAALYALKVQIASLYRQLYERDPAGPPPGELLALIAAREQELAQLTALGCTPGINREALVQKLPVLQQQIEECQAQLGVLQAAQQKACKKAADLRALYSHCFPNPPPTIAYEITKRLEPGHPVEFGFRMFDHPSDGTLFDSLQPHASTLSAERAALNVFELGLWPGNYALMAPPSGDYFLQLVDTSGQFTAVSPARFATWDDLVAFWKQMQATVRTARTEENCAECTDHLDCWSELSAFDDLGSHCGTIVDGLLGARHLYCSTFNQLYRALYACYQQRLDEAIRHCEELTLGVNVQEQACQALSDQLASLQQLISFLDDNHASALLPPEAFPCSTLLHVACSLSLEDQLFNLSLPSQKAIGEDYATTTEAIEKWLTPMWRPSTKYHVRLQVTDTVDNSTAHPFNFYFGFQTAGPLGFFHTDSLVEYVAKDKTPDQYLLTGLKGYIDYLHSYPNPDSQLIRAKPLFYEDARILLFFTKRYVYHFFGDWPEYNGLPALTGSAMQVLIKDPAEDIAFPNPPPPLVTTTEVPRAVVAWPAHESPRLPEDIRTLLNMRNPELLNPDFTGEDCWETGGEMIRPASVFASVTPQYLKPLKLYTAIVNNVYQGKTSEVHRYVFQTSRYPDFAAQVNSYHLDDGQGNQRDAFYRINLPLAVDIGLMFDVVSGTMSGPNADLARTWADPFDRLVSGVMNLAPLDAAISTEFNIVRSSATNAAVAVWIRNPESFNDPKLPDDVLKRSLRVVNGLDPDPNVVLFSKDCSQAFVMHPSRILLPTVRFRFAYIEWDGSQYLDRDVVITDAIPTDI